MPSAAAPTAAALATSDLGKARSNTVKRIAPWPSPGHRRARMRRPQRVVQRTAKNSAICHHALLIAVIALSGRRSLVGRGDRFSTVSKDRFTNERRQKIASRDDDDNARCRVRFGWGSRRCARRRDRQRGDAAPDLRWCGQRAAMVSTPRSGAELVQRSREHPGRAGLSPGRREVRR